MGNLIFRSTNCIFNKRVLMLGIDDSGKTTMLYKMKTNKIHKTIPTIGFNWETIEFKHSYFMIYDVRGGCSKNNGLWKHYYRDMSSIIFVVNCLDRDRIDDVKFELLKILNDQIDLKNIPILIFLNKYDKQLLFKEDERHSYYQEYRDNPITISELETILDLSKESINNKYNKRWHIEYSSNATGLGLNEGFEWLNKNSL
ncbi:hypothetical protein RB653_006406 [Dictyostelium firmibasis]|uniref:ADP-ribosylation factor n=1 Tax=Dictyostelium firmibasis TaxID=79012 RepID=A0AAN7U2P4_9MYCE